MNQVLTPKKEIINPTTGKPITATIKSHGAIPDAVKNLEEIDPKKVRCLGCRVLLKIMSVVSTTPTGLIFLSEEAIERKLFSQCHATLISKGSMAFSDIDGEHPEEGGKVITAKYAGIVVRDKDYNLYRFANDTDVVSIYEGE